MSRENLEVAGLVTTEGKLPMEHEANRAHAQKVVAARRGEGEARWWFGALVEIKLTAENTDGRLALVEITEPPGAEAPLHVHHREDEGFWVLDGAVTFEAGDSTVEASTGDFAFGPRDVPHRYAVGDAGCRMLFILTPAGFEGLIRELSEPAKSRSLPPPLEEEPDVERIQGLGQAYGIEMLG
jgi:quercetin dioxygenase-like cupin family protein